MNRRNILQSLVGFCFLPFISNNKIDKPKNNDKIKTNLITPKLKIFETIGEIQSINFSSEYDMSMFYNNNKRGDLHRYVEFPIETIMTITGKYGELTYTAFNVKLDDCYELHKNPHLLINSIDELPNSKDLEHLYTSIIKYKDVEFRLASLSLNIYNEETKDFTI
jgi:hypothetical protein